MNNLRSELREIAEQAKEKSCKKNQNLYHMIMNGFEVECRATARKGKRTISLIIPPENSAFLSYLKNWAEDNGLSYSCFITQLRGQIIQYKVILSWF